MVILIGTLSGSAAPIASAARNSAFQPGPTLNAAVLKPAQARILGGEQQAAFSGQKIIPIWRTPVVNKPGRVVFSQPAGASVRPAEIKAAGGG